MDDRPTSHIRSLALVLAVAALVMFTNLGEPRLWDRDEPRNAMCAFEMLERGDWVVPMFNDELRSHKPALLYWLMMSSYAVLGVNEFSARIWSAVLAVGTTLLTYSIGQRLFDRRVGLWAAIILASSLMFAVAGRAATPDSVLIFFSTLAIACYVWGTFPAQPRVDYQWNRPARLFPRWPLAAAMYTAMGFAVLAKGPVGLVLPTAVIGMYLLIVRLPRLERAPTDHRRLNRLIVLLRPFGPLHFLRTCWFMRPLTALTCVAVVAAPWYIWVGLRTDGDWLRGFFLDHNLGRAANAMEGHQGTLFYYPMAMLMGFFPWSVFTVPILIDVRRELSRGERAVHGHVLAICWVCVYLGLFSIAATKLPSYVTPCYPGLALLAAGFFRRWASHGAEPLVNWTRAAFVVLAVAGVSITVAIVVAARRFLPGDEWLGAIGLIPLLGAVVGLALSEAGRRHRAVLALGLSGIVFTTGLFGWAGVRADRHQTIDILLARIYDNSEEPRIATFAVHEPSWVFYAAQPLEQLVPGATEGPALPPPARSRDWHPKPAIEARYFLNGRTDRFVITTPDGLDQLQPLPPTVEVLARTPYFLKDDELVLLGVRRPEIAARRKGQRFEARGPARDQRGLRR